MSQRAARVFLSAFFLIFLTQCTFDIFSTRPKLVMSKAKSALHAAKLAKAETLASKHFRRAREHYLAARQAYRNKSFGDARRHAEASQKYSEEAEFLALRKKDESDNF